MIIIQILKLLQTKRQSCWKHGQEWSLWPLKGNRSCLEPMRFKDSTGMLMRLKLGCSRSFNWLKKRTTRIQQIFNLNIKTFEAELAANADRIQSVLAMGQNLIDRKKCSGSEEAVQIGWSLLPNNGNSLLKRPARSLWNWKKLTDRELYCCS